MDIQELNKITGDILNYEDKVKATKWRIEKMRAVGLHNGFKGELELTTYGCSSYRDTSKISVTQEEVIQILERTLADQEMILEKFKAEFAKIQ